MDPMPGERLELLQPGGYRILQKERGFHYTMDAVLLADFARVRPTDTAADFGTGTGILPLLCLSRGKGQRFYAFELQPDMAEMAGRTMALNGLEERVTVYSAPAELAPDLLPRQCCDAVLMNPPYGAFGATLQNPEEDRRVARHQAEEGLSGWFRAAFLLLKGKGRLSMVYPAARLLEAMTLLRQNHLEPKRFRLVYPFADRAPNLVLLEAIRDGRPGLMPEPPLIVHEADGTETAELRRIYRMEEQP